MFFAVELLSVNHPNSSDIFVLLLCKDSGCLGFMVIDLRSTRAPWGAQSFPVRYHGKGWGWNTSPQHSITSKIWIQAALGGAAPQKPLSGGEGNTQAREKKAHH